MVESTSEVAAVVDAATDAIAAVEGKVDRDNETIGDRRFFGQDALTKFYSQP